MNNTFMLLCVSCDTFVVLLIMVFKFMPLQLSTLSPTLMQIRGCPSTRSSAYGYYLFLEENLISWSSKRQGVVSHSSVETEYCGVANAVAKTSWIRNPLCKLHFPTNKETNVYYDNISTVYLYVNLVNH